MNIDFDPGVILVDKPAGRTSFAMVRAVRKVCGIKKVGHAGTLDPFATGLLVICIGRPATRLISGLMEGCKEYLATAVLGKVSTTHDPEGEISNGGPADSIDDELIESVVERFRGEILQTPPRYSAVKYEGKPLYHYARKGVHVEKEPRAVTIHTLDWRRSRAAGEERTVALDLRIVCSKGTYIRSLVADMGRALGCGAYLVSLHRTVSGFFKVSEAVPGSGLYGENAAELVSENMIPLEKVQNLLQFSK